jgi:hypothetical protein
VRVDGGKIPHNRPRLADTATAASRDAEPFHRAAALCNDAGEFYVDGDEFYDGDAAGISPLPHDRPATEARKCQRGTKSGQNTRNLTAISKRSNLLGLPKTATRMLQLRARSFASLTGKSPDRLILRDFRIDTSIPREHLSKVAAVARGGVQQST